MWCSGRPCAKKFGHEMCFSVCWLTVKNRMQACFHWIARYESCFTLVFYWASNFPITSNGCSEPYGTNFVLLWNNCSQHFLYLVNFWINMIMTAEPVSMIKLIPSSLTSVVILSCLGNVQCTNCLWFFTFTSTLLALVIHWVTQKVLLFDKSLNKGLSFYCLRFWQPTTQIQKKTSLRYMKLKTKFRFHDMQNLRNFGWSILQKDI